MSKKYSGRIHDPNHKLSDYDIYFNDELITGGNMYTLEDIAEIFGTESASGNPLIIQNAAPFKPVNIEASYPLTVYGPNIIEEDPIASATIAGITYTVNSDGSITADGTATALSQFEIIANSDYSFPFDTILSGCPAGGSSSTYDVAALYNKSPYQYYTDTGAGKTIPANTSIYRLVIRIRSGTTVSNLTFKPMLSVDSVIPSEYSQYTPPVTYDGPDYIELNKGYNALVSSESINIEYIAMPEE